MDDPESKAYTAFIGAAILIGLILGAYHFMKR